MIPPAIGRLETFATPLKFSTILLIGIFNKTVIPIPIKPEISPMIKVSALNT